MTMSQWQSPDPNFRDRVLDSFQRQPFMRTLNVDLVCIEAGYCELRVAYQRELTQQHGYFHAGVLATIADNSAGYAAFSLMQDNSTPLTVEFKINLLSPGQGECLIAKSKVIKNGRTLKICQAEVFNEKEGEESLCAIAIVSLMELPHRSDHA
jgi:uncharacterized protein (TIGR00369 family)